MASNTFFIIIMIIKLVVHAHKNAKTAKLILPILLRVNCGVPSGAGVDKNLNISKEKTAIHVLKVKYLYFYNSSF